MIISKEVARRIWAAHQEIEAAGRLLDDLRRSLARGEEPNPLDVFGRRRNYQLGVPSGENGHRLYDVEPTLAVYIIEAHIAAKQKDLAEACVIARIELTRASPPTVAGTPDTGAER
jgi:hypothetical protein